MNWQWEQIDNSGKHIMITLYDKNKCTQIEIYDEGLSLDEIECIVNQLQGDEYDRRRITEKL